MSGTVHAVRCSACFAEYRFNRDLISGQFVWLKPKVKRGGKCKHPSGEVEVLTDDAEWVKAS